MSQDNVQVETGVDKYEQISASYELFILGLGTLSLLNYLALVLIPLPQYAEQILSSLDMLLSLIFLYDFFRSLVRAPDKSRYLKWGWLDLLASLPYITIFRLARLVRVIRAARSLHAMRVRELASEISENRAESTFLGAAFVAILVVTISAILIQMIEDNVPGGNILDSEDALWWALVTISTVGYGDLYPVTFSGRILAGVVILVGVGLFSVVTGYLANRFRSPSDRAHSEDIAFIKSELAEIKHLLRERDPEVHLDKNDPGDDLF